MVSFTKLINLCLVFLIFEISAVSGQMLSLDWVSNLPASGSGQLTPNSITADGQGNVYVAGQYGGVISIFNGTDSTKFPNADGTRAFVAKFNSSGHLTWAKTIIPAASGHAYDESHGVAVDASGNVYWTGMVADFTATVAGVPETFTSKGTGSQAAKLDIMVAKLSPSGDFIWIKTFGSTAKDEAYGIGLDASGNVFVTGAFRGAASEVVNFGGTALTKVGNASAANMYALSLDNNGTVRWVITGASGNNVIIGRALTTDQTGNVYVTGEYKGNPSFGGVTVLSSAGKAPFILKLTNAGTTTWAKGYLGNWDATGYGIAVDKAGGVYTVGEFKGTYDFDPTPGGAATVKNLISHPTGSGNFDGFVAKLNSNGEYAWAHAIFSTSTAATALDRSKAVAVDKDDNVYVTGSFFATTDFNPSATADHPLTSRGSNDVFVCKLEPSGAFIWAFQIGGEGSDAGNSIFVDDNYTVYTTGAYRGDAEFSLTPATSSVIMNAGGTANGVGYLHKVTQRFCSSTAASLSLTDCDSIRINGEKYTASGTYIQTLVNSTGCDSILTLNLTVNHSVVGSSINHTVCDSFEFNGQMHYTSGPYTHVLNTSAGCDSTVTLHLTVNQSIHTVLTEAVCSSYTLDTATYTEAGVYEHLFETVNGCDSLVTLELTILNTADTVAENACFSYVAGLDTFTQSGWYTQAFTNVDGCDSLIVIDLTIRDVDVSVTRSGITLTAGQAGATYLWLDCDDDYKPISGATQQMFGPEFNGNYAVAVTWDGCTDTSACYEINGITNKVRHFDDTHLSVYPNPASDILYVVSTGDVVTEVRLLGVAGNVLMQRQRINEEKTMLDISAYAAGVYLLEVRTADTMSRYTIVKK